MADYYGLTPPQMACASATLLMDLPRHDAKPEMVRDSRRTLRDLVHNPQRHPPHAPDVIELVGRRAEAVQLARKLRETDRRNRQARRAAFTQIREINAAIVERRRGNLVVKQAELASASRNLEQGRIAAGREYFFGLYDRARLDRLLGAVPTERDFRV